MRSAALVALALLAAAPAAAPARADDLADQLDAQAAAVERAHAQVAGKQADAARAHGARARAAYKLLRGAGTPLAVAPAERLAIARGRATARLLLARDRAEVALLAGETERLAAAAARIASDRARVQPPPADLALVRPVSGPIVRRFGALVHDRSRATLSRRGVDFETRAEAPAVAPAAGIVRYAGPIRGLDHGVVLDAGAVWIVVAKLGAPAVATGDVVAAGAPLGPAARTRVYLEVRVPVGPGGLPVDPAPYLRAPL